MRTVKDVRYELKEWGNFWSRQESGQGYASKSNIESLRESLQRGCAASSDLHLFSSKADNIYVPGHIEKIDNSLVLLSSECRVAIRQRYIAKGNVLYFSDRQTFLFWVRKAERELL